MRNRTNRLNNFENANLSKTASAAFDQMQAIETIKEKGVKRAATILPSMNKFIYVDYNEMDKVKKTCKINEIFINFDQK